MYSTGGMRQDKYHVVDTKPASICQNCIHGLRTAGETSAAPHGKRALKLWLHPDQYENVRTALDLVKCEARTDYDAVALDYLATFYLSQAEPRS
jgi:hypothetical protein